MLRIFQNLLLTKVMLTKVEDAVAVFDLQVRDKTVVTCISPEEKQNPKTLAINTSSKLHV